MKQNRWWLVAAVGLVVFMVQLDATIVSVALPVMESDLRTTTTVSEWVVLAHLLPIIALVLPSGRWLDGVGKRQALAVATAGFALSSMLAGLAPGIALLIAARVTQGVFGAVLLALTPLLSTVAVRPEARGRAMGIITTLGPLGAVSGPALGGFLVDAFGWPWIFYVNLPVSIIVIGVGLKQMKPDGRLRAPDRTWSAEAVMLSAAATALLLGLSLTASHGLAWSALTLLAIPPFLSWWRMATSRAVRDLLQLPGMAGPHIGLLVVFTTTGLVQFLAPFYLDRVQRVSAAVIGLTVLAFPIAMAALGAISGVLADRWGSARTAVLGTVVTTAGLVSLVPLDPSWQVGDVAWRLAAVGVGVGLFNAPNMTTAMSIAPRNLLGTTAASTSLARQLGLALGPAVATAAWALSGYRTTGMRVGLAGATALGVLSVVVLARSRVPTRLPAADTRHLTPVADRAPTAEARR